MDCLSLIEHGRDKGMKPIKASEICVRVIPPKVPLQSYTLMNEKSKTIYRFTRVTASPFDG
jgi:hypothetical protein